jgi:hypothetical protein
MQYVECHCPSIFGPERTLEVIPSCFYIFVSIAVKLKNKTKANFRDCQICGHIYHKLYKYK